MHLNPAKCSFRVQARKFLGFMLTMRGIKDNQDNCRAVVDMRIPISVNEVHQLIGRLVALSRFLSCIGDKTFLFFVALRKNEKFKWTSKCDEAFTKVK